MQNSITINLEALDDDLIEGDEYIDVAITADANTFKTFKANVPSASIKIIDADNTEDNRVFFTTPLLDTLTEGTLRFYTTNLKSPLKLQRAVQITFSPEKILPAYVTQSGHEATYDPNGTGFTVEHLNNLVKGNKSVVFNWNISDPHTGTYRFFWKNGYSNLMELQLPDKDFDVLEAPNTFSPNGDGVNDTWNIKSLKGIDCVVTIVNRYGAIVYKSLGYATAWDGKLNGVDVPAGAYYYRVSVQEKIFSGNINVIR
jgi:gliding motility-associated-like protein